MDCYVPGILKVVWNTEMNTLPDQKLVQWGICVKRAEGTYPRQDIKGQERHSRKLKYEGEYGFFRNKGFSSRKMGRTFQTERVCSH